MKYLIRADKKGGIYDLSKARDYIDYEMMGMQEPEEPPICGKRGDDTFMNYCPNCGAEMKGEGNADNSQI